jgi:sulfite exporter TauE/SafE
MNPYWIALITGLTTGGLSCMAVQGGLITGSLARQLESDIAAGRLPAGRRPRLALPILVFLAAKLIAYTALGFLLGLLGSAFSLNSVARGLLSLIIAVFMLGNALRMFEVHPIFRYFSFEPPHAVRRLVRRVSKSQGQDDALVTPGLLGALTVLLPCGITQAMLAAALSTGDPLAGALTMFAFILGTTPPFFALTYLATRLGAMVEKYFMRIVAITLLVLGMVALDQGLNQLGSPYSPSKLPRLVNGWLGRSDAPLSGAFLSDQLELEAGDYGYTPEVLYAPAGKPVTLHLITRGTESCSRGFTIPALAYEVLLPAKGERSYAIPAQPAGQQIEFSCSMGMYTGVIIFK